MTQLVKNNVVSRTGDTMTGALVNEVSVSTPLIITASGNLDITPAAGSGVDINLSTTGDFIINTDDLVVDTSTGRVGIGITTPSTALHVSGTIRAERAGVSTQYVELYSSGGSSIISAIGTAFEFNMTGGVNALSINSGGTFIQIGGATNPGLQVDVQAASHATGLIITSAAAAGGVGLAAISSGTNKNLTIDAKGSGTITLGGTSTGNINISRTLVLTNALGVAYGGTNATTQSTNALVYYNGTAYTSSSDLTYNGTDLVLSTNHSGSFHGGRFVLGVIGGNAGMSIGLDASVMQIYREGANALLFNNVTQLRIASGNLVLSDGYAKIDGDGTYIFNIPADATGNTSAATGRIPILVGSGTKYIRYYDD